MVANTRPPKVFISYAWEDDIKPWVRALAKRLRKDGVETVLDQWETEYGDQLPEFMEVAVRASDFVIVICTPKYKEKSDDRVGGVGYEGTTITAEIFAKSNHRKFIPILRKGDWFFAAPSWVAGKIYLDLRGNPYSELNYRNLLRTLHGKKPIPPPVGTPPDFPDEDDNPYTPNLGLKAYLSVSFKRLKLFLSKTKQFFRIVGIAGLVLGLCWAVSWTVPQLLSLVPTVETRMTTPSASTVDTPGSPTDITEVMTRLPRSTPIPLSPTTVLVEQITNTATATQTHTPVPITALACTSVTGLVIREFVWLRTGPGVHYRALAIFDQGITVTVLGKNGNGEWLVVSLPDGQQGWVSSTSIELNVSGCDLAVATEPPTQTPLPTVDFRNSADPCVRAQRQHQKIIQAYGASSGDAGYDSGSDLNGDGTINIIDVGIMVDRWPEGCPAP